VLNARSARKVLNAMSDDVTAEQDIPSLLDAGVRSGPFAAARHQFAGAATAEAFGLGSGGLAGNFSSPK
jgi:hypothetical protein